MNMRAIAVLFVPLFAVPLFAGFVAALLAQGLPVEQGLPQTLDPAMLANQQTIWITTLVGFATTIAAIIASMWRESRNTKATLLREVRNREWEIEDRRMGREQAQIQLEHQTTELKTVTQLEADLTRAEALRVKATLEAEALRVKAALGEESARVQAALGAEALKQRRALLLSQQTLTDKIDANMAISQHAFDAANNFESKIAHMQELFESATPDRETMNAKMSKQVDETHTVVTREFPSASAESPSSQQALHDIQEIAQETKDAVEHIVDARGDESDKS